MGVTALVFGLFWHIWNIFAGEVLAVRELTMLVGNEGEESIIWTLPFAVSHSWDMLVAPLFVLAFSWLQSRTEEGTDENDMLVIGLIGGLVVGLTLMGLIGELDDGVLTGGLALGLLFGLIGGLVAGLGFGLGFGFSCGIFWTMPLGAVFGVVVILPAIVLLIVFMVLREAIRGFSKSNSSKTATSSEC